MVISMCCHHGVLIVELGQLTDGGVVRATERQAIEQAPAHFTHYV